MIRSNKSVLITGASSGIGRALALHYAQKGWNLYLVSRRESHQSLLSKECLELNPNIEVIPMTADVTDYSALSFAIDRHLSSTKLDVVIANAGVGIAGFFDRMSVEDYRAVIDVNVFGVLNTLKATREHLNPEKSNLCLIGSVNSILSLPGKSPYCMSKFAVKALADSIYFELAPKNIKVTLIMPGLVESEIRIKNNKGELTEQKDPAPAWLTMSSEKAAKIIYESIRKSKKSVVITRHGKILTFLESHFPCLLYPLKKGFMGKI